MRKVTRYDPEYYADALFRAREIDRNADHAAGSPDVLLIDLKHVVRVMALFPGCIRDDNNPPTTWTRVVLPAPNEE